jgi:glucose/arabinose dehydrogenase
MNRTLLLFFSTVVAACASADPESWPFDATPVASFEEPWAMTFLPDGRQLVTEKAGRLQLVSMDGTSSLVFDAFPGLLYGGQGGLGDVVLHPDFAANKLVYISYAEAGEGDLAGAAVARGRLELNATAGVLKDLEVIWRQVPKVTGRGHYGHRIAFSPDGYLFISSGDRQKFDPAQDMQGNLGKILRLNDDGSVPADNPFAEQGGITAQIWTLGHRNPLGIAFDASGRLWTTEMGPQHGDELTW